MNSKSSRKGVKPKNIIQSIERASTLLDILGRFPQGQSLGILSEMAGLSKGTTHRLLSTLSYLGYVRQDSSTKAYALGFKLAELGNLLLSQLDLRNVARSHLIHLAEQMQETVHLVIRDYDEALYIDKVDLYLKEAGLQMVSRLGSRIPMHSCAVGKILLASLSIKMVEQIVNSKGLTGRTEHTITETSDLMKHLDMVRKNGFAIDNEENEKGIRCVAAPIFNGTGDVLAAISMSGPTTRITNGYINSTLKDKVCRTALKISRDLGYRGDGKTIVKGD